jgi:hypothetical protein
MSPHWEAHKELAAGAGRSLLTRAQAILVFATAILTPLACGGLCAAAILVPAPVGVVPLVALCCVGCPMFAAWQIPSALETIRPAAAALRQRRWPSFGAGWRSCPRPTTHSGSDGVAGAQRR